ncbi:hypothetical protein C8A03DRAFT_45021 [Achaetomium macrosporum]|uniref:Uncharacterized protein n=1 Tax=Achaetomium macrosporum TaxID=79813 RepID=A0AAN7HB74_9PEZI|nr:hypothetical protein C8A03DRAFT_45021 [Achaetomium macrosporum]
MATTDRTHRRRGGWLRLPNLALITTLFLHPSQLSTADAAPVGLSHAADYSGEHALHKRIQGEHVILADCRDRGGVVSSQMAYFVGDPGPTPQDVAVVVTPAGQAALWVNSNTSGLFTDTGVTFTANLGPRVEDGQFAGTGDNGYGNFSCYQKYVAQLYTYGETTCNQVYLCDHSNPPAAAGSSGSGSMSQETVIGIAVGVVGGLLFLVAVGLVFWFYRRLRKANAKPSSELLRQGSLSVSTDPSSRSEANKSPNPVGMAQPVMTHMRAIYEVDGRRFRVEMANDTGKFEMDALGHGSAELDDSQKTGTSSEPSSGSPGAISPLSPALSDSPASRWLKRREMAHYGTGELAG